MHIFTDDCSQVTLGKIVEASVVVMLVVLILVLSARAIVRIDRKGRADSYCDGLGGGVMTISSHGGLSHSQFGTNACIIVIITYTEMHD